MKFPTLARMKAQQDLRTLDQQIRVAHRLVLGWFVATTVGYAAYRIFGGDTAASTGGVFGDFFGGLLNPVVSYAAFYWLTKAVRLQKEELAETREALDDASVAQREQARYALMAVHLDGLSAQIGALTSDIELRRAHLSFLTNQTLDGARHRYYSMTGKALTESGVRELMADINGGINRRIKDRAKYVLEIELLLNQSRDAVGKKVTLDEMQIEDATRDLE